MLLSFNLSGYAENTCEVWWDLRMTAVAFFYKNSFINLPIAVTNWNILKILLDFSHEKIGRGFWTLKKLLSIYLLSIHGQIYQPSLLVSKGDLDLWKCLRYGPSEQYSPEYKKSSLRYFVLQKCSIPSFPVAVLCGIEPQQLQVIGVSLFTSWDFILDSKCLV